jgi:hypothetical protein
MLATTPRTAPHCPRMRRAAARPGPAAAAYARVRVWRVWRCVCAGKARTRSGSGGRCACVVACGGLRLLPTPARPAQSPPAHLPIRPSHPHTPFLPRHALLPFPSALVRPSHTLLTPRYTSPHAPAFQPARWCLRHRPVRNGRRTAARGRPQRPARRHRQRVRAARPSLRPSAP